MKTALETALACLAFLSIAIVVWQHVVARRFRFWRTPPVYDSAGVVPGVTLIKPLKGLDAQTERCLESWLTQDYGGSIQVLCAVGEAQDPVCRVVRSLQARHPGRRVQLEVNPGACGANPKLSILQPLESSIEHEVIVISDADVEAPPGLLREVISQLRKPGTGLIHCLYAYANPVDVPTTLEAISVNCDFWCQVLQSRAIGPTDFALGAVMGMRRETLLSVGGFAAVVDYLADDFRLGNLVAGSGGRIVLASQPVRCWSGNSGWAGSWSHQLRWARTVRYCKPGPWFASVIANPTCWPVAWLCARPGPVSLATLVAALALRLGTAAWQWRRLVGSAMPARTWPLVPVRDFMQLALWIGSWFGSSLEWHGRTFRVLKGGFLRPISSTISPPKGQPESRPVS